MVAALGLEPGALPPGAVRIPLQKGPFTIAHFSAVKADCYPLEWDQLHNTIQEINATIHSSGVIAFQRLVVVACGLLLLFAAIAMGWVLLITFRTPTGEESANRRAALGFVALTLGVIAVLVMRKFSAVARRQVREALASKLLEVNERLAPEDVEFVLDAEHGRGKGRSQRKVSLIVRPLHAVIQAVTVVGTVAAPGVATATVVSNASPLPTAARVPLVIGSCSDENNEILP